MLDLLPSTHELNNDYNKKCNLIWKGKLACLLLFNERKLSLGSIAGHFTETVCSISYVNYTNVNHTFFVNPDFFYRLT